MVVKALYDNRDIHFSDGSHSGSGLSNLMSYLSQNKNKITLLEIDGQTKSYTYQRQIYLLANIVSTISAFKIKINGRIVTPDKVILPVYS